MAWNITAVTSLFLVPALALVTASEKPASNLGATELVTVAGGSPSQIEFVHNAVGLFERAGLELPVVSVVFQDEETGCGGALGRYVAAGAGSESRIDVCVGPDAPPRQQRYVVAHELGHAWISSTLDDEARREFLVLHGLDRWNGGDVRWRLRGVEWAADTIAWGVGGDDGVYFAIPRHPCEVLLVGYFQLTGRFPLAGPAACEGR